MAARLRARLAAAATGQAAGRRAALARPGPAGRARELASGARGYARRGPALARHGGAMMAAAAVALAFQFPLSNLWHGSTYRLDAHVAAADAAMAVVPDGATVQTTLDLLAPLAARTDTFWIGTPGNPADPVHRLRRHEQRLQPADHQRPRLHRADLPA